VARPSRREVWTVDLGIAGKVRPCLLLTDYPQDNELALITVVPHTTSLRGNPWEVRINRSFLKTGAFHVQQIQSVSVARLIRHIGTLTEGENNRLLSVIDSRLIRFQRFGFDHVNLAAIQAIAEQKRCTIDEIIGQALAEYIARQKD
jgi:mRNA interferase MazF